MLAPGWPVMVIIVIGPHVACLISTTCTSSFETVRGTNVASRRYPSFGNVRGIGVVVVCRRYHWEGGWEFVETKHRWD